MLRVLGTDCKTQRRPIERSHTKLSGGPILLGVSSEELSGRQSATVAHPGGVVANVEKLHATMSFTLDHK